MKSNEPEYPKNNKRISY